jgi:N-formylglutamate amidohydrolase
MNYEIILPAPIAQEPFLLHVPHSSTYIPEEYRGQLCLDDEGLNGELLAMTDWFTDELFGQAGSYGATLFVNGVSRLVMDPERFSNDQDEPMSAKGMGAIYTKTSQGGELRAKSFSVISRQEVMDELYWPYSRTFHNLVTDQLAQFDRCMIIDGHSFPSIALPHEDEKLIRPDICFGYESFHEPAGLVDALEECCRHNGLTSARNQPFSGSYVPANYFQKEERVTSIMIEINRSLYMDETSGTRSIGYDQLILVVKQLIKLAFSYKS